MNKYYLAIRGCEPIPVIFKTNLTQSKIDCYVQQYGLDFIGIYESYTEAIGSLLIDREFFDSLALDIVDTVNHLERCYQLEYKEMQ